MPLHHAVLALLTDGPSHGYQLKSAFEATVGPQWGGLNIGHLYQILERAERDGLVSSRRQHQRVKPDRRVYQLTATGRQELERWLAEPTIRQGGHRDDFFLKLMAAARGDARVVSGVLSRQRAYLLSELRSLTELRNNSSEDTVVGLLLTAAELHVRADLGLIEAAEETPWPIVAQRIPRHHHDATEEADATG